MSSPCETSSFSDGMIIESEEQASHSSPLGLGSLDPREGQGQEGVWGEKVQAQTPSKWRLEVDLESEAQGK